MRKQKNVFYTNFIARVGVFYHFSGVKMERHVQSKCEQKKEFRNLYDFSSVPPLCGMSEFMCLWRIEFLCEKFLFFANILQHF